MRLQYLSDVHLEFHRDHGLAFADSVEPVAETLVLAGDVAPMGDLSYIEPIRALCQKFARVLYVAGNHEFYGAHVKAATANIRALPSAVPNLHILEPGTLVILDGQRFVGGTLWFADGPGNRRYARLMNDFTAIRGFVPWVYQQHLAMREAFDLYLEPGDVVVTHHLPSPMSVGHQYLGSNLNRFFVTNLEALMLERHPAIWIHGHGHTSARYRIGATRVAANPLGYVGYEENAAFDPRSVIET